MVSPLASCHSPILSFTAIDLFIPNISLANLKRQLMGLYFVTQDYASTDDNDLLVIQFEMYDLLQKGLHCKVSSLKSTEDNDLLVI